MSNVPTETTMACPSCGRKTAAGVQIPQSGVKVCTGCKKEFRYSRTLKIVFETEVF